MKFLKMNDSELKFVQKRLGQCMGPRSKIWEEVDDLDKRKSSMNVEELKELIKITILMIGQTNVAGWLNAHLITRRKLCTVQNWLEKLIKKMKSH